jgi:hypothetical protein
MRRGLHSRQAPKWLLGGGLVALAAGYALLQYIPHIEADMGADDARLPLYQVTARVLFWGGLALLGLGVAAWYRQPPARRRPIEEEHEPSLEELTAGFHPTGEEDDDLIECPHCRQKIYEQSERCPHCERYISEEDAPARPPAWIAIGVTLCLIMVLIWILARS